MDCKFCIDQLDFSVKVVDITTKCKYHRKIGQVYTASKVAPLGLCRELFYAAYPACLTALYSGRPMRCWLRKKGIRNLSLVEELLKIVYHPMNGPFRRVVIEVIEVGVDCPKGYRKGDKFHFNIDKQDELCPASFSAIYPFLRLIKESKKETGITESIQVHCPDWVGVTYEVKV